MFKNPVNSDKYSSGTQGRYLFEYSGSKRKRVQVEEIAIKTRIKRVLGWVPSTRQVKKRISGIFWVFNVNPNPNPPIRGRVELGFWVFHCFSALISNFSQSPINFPYWWSKFPLSTMIFSADFSVFLSLSDDPNWPFSISLSSSEVWTCLPPRSRFTIS